MPGKYLFTLICCFYGVVITQAAPFTRQVNYHPEKALEATVPVNPFLRELLGASTDHSWQQLNSQAGLTGKIYTRYQQFFRGYPVQDAVLIFECTNNLITQITGVFADADQLQPMGIGVSESSVVMAQNFLPANSRILEDFNGNGWKWIIDTLQPKLNLIFELNYFPVNSLERHTLIIDATTGRAREIKPSSCFADVAGLAHTSYHGIKNIPCYSDSGSFLLKCTTKGQGIFTMNLNHHLNYNNITEFTNPDTNWYSLPGANNQFATDAHYCADRYYDFLYNAFSRNSLDNNGYRLVSYLNYGTTLANAFWNGQAVVYGSVSPLTTLDIAGHEFTHGLIQKTAQLSYSYEPGTINEALSDMFGAALEFYSAPQQFNWLIGEQSGNTLRSMSHPNDFNQPAMYHGNHWYYGSGDNGGVHINSGFLNKWFHLVSAGGQGTNEAGVAYHINGIGMNRAIAIVYHTIIAYLTPGSGFEDFRRYTLLSARDNFGSCSAEFKAVLKAWEAVGLSSATIAQISARVSAGPGDSVLISTDYEDGATYDWFLNGQYAYTTPTENIYVNLPGLWQVQKNLCGSVVASNNFLITAKSGLNSTVHQVKETPIKVFPNPAFGSTTLTHYGEANNDILEYGLFDLSGRCLLKSTSVENPATIELRQVPTGMYILQIRKGKVLQNERLIVR